MRIEKDKEENKSNKEANFKASKKIKTKDHKSSDILNNELDDEEVNFVKKLKVRSRKYKGNLPFKCFNYGELGHFASRCPYTKNRNSNKEEDSSFKNYKKGKIEKKRQLNRQNKKLCSNEDSSSYNESDDDGMEVLFMVLESQGDVVDSENINS